MWSIFMGWCKGRSNTVSWGKIALPKVWGGWGIKDLPLFAKYLVAKLGWHILSMDNIWTVVVKIKYIGPIPLEEWVRRIDKKYQNASVI